MESRSFVTVFFLLEIILLSHARFSKDAGCGVTKGCFSDCRSFDGCTYIISWAQKPTGVDFTIKGELMSSGAQYVAFGLSSDDEMGEDSVTACVMNSGTFTVENSYNPDDDSNEMTTNPSLGLSSITTAYTNGILECSFNRENTTSDPKIFSLITDWYLFWAIGEYEDSEKEEHEDWGISERIVDLQSFDDVGEMKDPKIKVHACLAIIAWIGLCSIGVVLARYYKPMWVSKKLFGTAIWFQVHRAVMIVAAVLNLIAVIVIFNGSFEIYGTDIQKVHPFFGIIVTVLSTLNCVGGFLRPGPKSQYRPYFNWGHLAMGLGSYIFGVFNIGIGVTIDKASVPFQVVYVVVTFVIYQIAIEVTLEIIDRKGKQNQTKTGSFNTADTQMTTMSASKNKLEENINGRNSTHDLPDSEPAHYCARLKSILLGVHIGMICVFTLSILVVVAIY